MTLSFAEFSRANRERSEAKNGFNHKLNSWSTSDWFLATLGELGEAANVAKKLNRLRDKIPGNKTTPEQLKEQLRKELGDTYVYLDLTCQSLGIAIGDAALDVFNAKSVEIGYPNTFLNEDDVLKKLDITPKALLKVALDELVKTGEAMVKENWHTPGERRGINLMVKRIRARAKAFG